MKNRLSLSGFEKNHSTFISSLDPSAAEEFVTKLEDQANEFFNKRYFGPSGG
jgi:hypothetical protein